MTTDRIERRRRWVRLIVRLIAGTEGVTRVQLRERLGILTKSLFDRMLDEDEAPALPLDALDDLLAELGPAVVAPALERIGYRVVPIVALAPTPPDVIQQASIAVAESGDAAAKLLHRLKDGLTPAEWAELEPEFDQAIEAWTTTKEVARRMVVEAPATPGR